MFCFAVVGLSLALWQTGYMNAVSPPAKVYILAGQSNMVGIASSSNLPSDLAGPRDDVWGFEITENVFFPKPRWSRLDAGGVFGPEISFARRMADHHRQPVGVIKVAKGGTSLAQDWSPDRRGDLYDWLVATVQEAVKTGAFEIEAVIWMQGERDARIEAMAGLYAQNLTHFIQKLRGDLNQPDLPFVFGRVNPPKMYSPFVDQVRRAQQGLDMPYAVMVDCDGLTKQRDGLHYNAAGQVALGQRFATALIKLTATAEPVGRDSE